MLHIGHPILGDPLYPIPDTTPDCAVTKKPRVDDLLEAPVEYASDDIPPLTMRPNDHYPEMVAISSKCYPRLCLHAFCLKFNHPVTKEAMEITAHEANMI